MLFIIVMPHNDKIINTYVHYLRKYKNYKICTVITLTNIKNASTVVNYLYLTRLSRDNWS